MSEQQFTPQEYIRIKVFPKVSSLAKMLKKLLYFWNRKTHAGFFSFFISSFTLSLIGRILLNVGTMSIGRRKS